MIEFFIMFLIAGAVIGFIVDNKNVAILLIISVSVIWALIFGPWAIATFAELLLGYFVGLKIKRVG